MSNITIEDMPHFDKTSHNRAWKKTPAGIEAKKKYRHNNSKHVTDAKYLSVPFVAVDGEGINIRSGRDKGKHLYVMLAISDKPPLINPGGIPSRDVLMYLWENLEPDNINVIYGGSYDFNNWIRNLFSDEVRRIYRGNYTSKPVQYAGFGLKWMKGKQFEISRGTKTVIINDVISFFQRPFIAACDEYLGTYEGREQLVREKARRGNFTIAEVEAISDYNQLELRLLVRLMEELRLRLNKVNLRPRRWNSPGAIAAALFLREKVKQHRDEDIPAAVAEAGRYAYAGGRFEMIKYGAVKSETCEYDLNSAYPAAMRELPSLANGKWVHYNKDMGNHGNFTVYKVRYSGRNPNIPGPIFHRGANGTISYPLEVTNWVWSPEYKTLQEYCEQIDGAEYQFLEAWEFVPDDPTDKPFWFIDKLYKLRQALKKAKDGAHVGIKLGLNSMYGKVVQQVGWRAATDKHPLRIPTYHQLEWGGYITSWCRAEVLRAALTDIDAVVAFETDALFTSRALPITTGEGLGEWEQTRFASLTYVQSGHYYGTAVDEKGVRTEVVKCRGVDRGFITRRKVEARLRRVESERVLVAPLTRFYGVGIALARGLDKFWCKWITEDKVLNLKPTGKRSHGACWCNEGRGDPFVMGTWHDTYSPVSGGVSSQFPVEWINPDPNMTELAEMRESEVVFDD